MRIRQWDIWKSKPAGFERAHWFVILSAEERLDSNRPAINGLACYTLRGKKNEFDVVLNGADGFDHPTVCQCDYIYPLDKRILDSPLGSVSWERRQQIKGKLKEVFRL
jgi:mRNA-degrading endonuclease toxin of MazEF toxin-antitoxin module